MSTATSIAFTMYPVTELPRAVAFYRDALGLSPTNVTTDFWQEFDIAGSTFGIGTFEQVGTPGTAQSLALEVDNMTAIRAGLDARGVKSTEPHELAHCWIAVVHDPDGNQVWLHQAKPR